MGDEKNTEELEDVSGGPAIVAAGGHLTDATEDVGSGDGVPCGTDDESMEDVEGGEFINGGAWTGT